MGVKDIDKGWKKIVREMGRADGGHVKVGLPAKTTVAPPKGGSKSEPFVSPSELIRVAAALEFGSPTRKIPSRAAIRQAFDLNVESITRAQNKFYGLVLDLRFTTEQALDGLGQFHAGQVKKQITKLRTPPNAESTIQRKGSDNPLIDHSQYRNSINHEVVI